MGLVAARLIDKARDAARKLPAATSKRVLEMPNSFMKTNAHNHAPSAPASNNRRGKGLLTALIALPF
jgi:hypothetical protein